MHETPYRREPGYPQRYRDQRFRAAHGPRTDRRERAALGHLLRLLPVAPGPWLDAPSGAGRLSAELPGPVVQLDRDAAMLLAAGPHHSRVCGSTHALPFATASFAGGLCMRLFQHLPTPDERIAVLREFRRVCRGPLVVSFFDSRTLPHLRRRLRRATGKNRSGRGAVSRGEFAAEAAAAGWRLLRLRALLPWFSEQTLALLTPADGPPPP